MRVSKVLMSTMLLVTMAGHAQTSSVSGTAAGPWGAVTGQISFRANDCAGSAVTVEGGALKGFTATTVPIKAGVFTAVLPRSAGFCYQVGVSNAATGISSFVPGLGAVSVVAGGLLDAVSVSSVPPDATVSPIGGAGSVVAVPGQVTATVDPAVLAAAVNAAVSSTIAAEAAARNTAIASALATEVTARNAAIAAVGSSSSGGSSTSNGSTINDMSSLDFAFGALPATGPAAHTVRLQLAGDPLLPYSLVISSALLDGSGPQLMLATPGTVTNADGSKTPSLSITPQHLLPPNIITYTDTTNVFNYTPTPGTLYSVVTLIGGGAGTPGSGRGASADGGNGGATVMAGRTAGGGGGSSNSNNKRGYGGTAQGLPGDELFNGFNGGRADNTSDGPGNGGEGGGVGEGSGGPLGGVPSTDHENGASAPIDGYGIGASGPSAVGPDGDGTDGHPSPGAGGGAKVRFKILNPTGTYQGQVGAAGLGSAATDRGRTGADGRPGKIQVEEFFQ